MRARTRPAVAGPSPKPAVLPPLLAHQPHPPRPSSGGLPQPLSRVCPFLPHTLQPSSCALHVTVRPFQSPTTCHARHPMCLTCQPGPRTLCCGYEVTREQHSAALQLLLSRAVVVPSLGYPHGSPRRGVCPLARLVKDISRTQASSIRPGIAGADARRAQVRGIRRGGEAKLKAA